MNILCSHKLISITLLIFLSGLFCSNLAARDYVRSLKSAPKFTGIECEDAFTVNIHKGKIFDAKVYGSEEDIKKVTMRVVNDNLQIKYIRTPFIGLQVNSALRVEVTMPELESLAMSGSGSFNTKDKFESAQFSIALSGSGLVSLSQITSNNMNIEISGSGTVELSGYSSKMDLAIAGSGTYSGEKFNVDDADITIAGSGDATANVVKNLNATVSGSGNIYYLGKPTVNRVITGSGDIAPLKKEN